MKKILILSYHFPPMNVIASQRALGYANHFKKFGFEPTILTFDWSKPIEDQYCDQKDFQDKIQYENNDYYSVIRIPVIRNRFLRWMEQKEGSFIYKVWIFWCWLVGNLDVRPAVILFGKSEFHYLKNYVKKGDYDIVLGIFSPHFHLKNCYNNYKENATPYALDFRDLWSNTAAMKTAEVKEKSWGKINLTRHYWKKYTSDALSLSIVGNIWVEKLKNFTNHKNVISVFNGFENELMVKRKPLSEKKFSIVYTGTLYAWQEYQMMIRGVKKFLEGLSTDEQSMVEVLFPGTQKPGFDLVIDFIKNEIGNYNLTIMERIDKQESIRLQHEAAVLIFATSPSVLGFYSGKIFEYISSGVPILAGPKDHGAVCDLIQETQTGMVYNSENEFSNFIGKYFNAWKQGYASPLSKQRNIDKISEYTREFQCGVLAKELKSRL